MFSGWDRLWETHGASSFGASSHPGGRRSLPMSSAWRRKPPGQLPASKSLPENQTNNETMNTLDCLRGRIRTPSNPQNASGSVHETDRGKLRRNTCFEAGSTDYDRGYLHGPVSSRVPTASSNLMNEQNDGEERPAALGDADQKPPLAVLTPRQREVYHWICEGKRDREIAMILGISYRTVTVHVRDILHRLGAENRTTAAMMAARFSSNGNGATPSQNP